jgi:hypothetical protein
MSLSTVATLTNSAAVERRSASNCARATESSWELLIKALNDPNANIF